MTFKTANHHESSPAAYPQHIENLRRQLMQQLSALMGNQTRTRTFASSISALIRRDHAAVIADLEDSLGRIEDPLISTTLSKTMTRCHRLDEAFQCLIDERQRQLKKNGLHLQRVIEEFNQTTEYLSSTLVEKELLERQSHVLESIILSHDKVAQWKEFVQDILAGFHTIFPFNFFFIAFAEEHGLSLYFYYLGDYPEETKQEVRRRLSKEMLRQLDLPIDAPLDIEEFQMPESTTDRVSLEDVQMLTVSVPEYAPGLAGLLGVAFASDAPLSPQEQSVVRSLLSVMVMIVGSSKVLSRTLSELEYYSRHDPLTGIYNRRYFNDMLEYEIGRSERHKHEFSILLLDLDDFKDINDSYGHPVGDQVLIRIAQAITGHLRKADIATRIGGDEFAVLLPETPPIGAKKVAQSIKEHLQSLSYEDTQGKCFHAMTSIGIISYPKDAQTFEGLMTGVDSALYRAKDMGKNEICEFDPEVHQAQGTRDNRAFAEELRQALNEDRIQPYFQPIIDCKSGEIFAYESVARLTDANGETIPAGKFIETIEKYGLGRHMDRIIVRKVLQASRQQMIQSGTPSRFFINLSAQEIQGRGILTFAEDLCHQLGVSPSSIVFEILERDAIGDMTNMRKFLTKLRSDGFAFALDDFGSGYNSFHYLREMHFEYVKIDGAFVRNITTSNVDRVLVSNLARMCKELGTLTIGEFVESEEIMDILRDMDIDYAQGYHLGMPRPHLH